MIYIIRHGETVWNLAKRKQGNLDSPLTLKGLEQATLCGQRLPPASEGNSATNSYVAL